VADVKDRPFGTRRGSRFPPGASAAPDGLKLCGDRSLFSLLAPHADREVRA
jgi:hypothetical protein